MAYDYIQIQPFTLSPAAGGIGTVIEGLQDPRGGLPTLGFTQNGGTNQTDNITWVAAWDAAFTTFVMVQFVYLGGQQFTQCITVANSAATSESQVQETVGAIANVITKMTFL